MDDKYNISNISIEEMFNDKKNGLHTRIKKALLRDSIHTLGQLVTTVTRCDLAKTPNLSKKSCIAIQKKVEEYGLRMERGEGMAWNENSPYPRSISEHPGAFINIIAEEGTKEEAIKYLQETWNDYCKLKTENEKLRKKLKDAGEKFVKYAQKIREQMEKMKNIIQSTDR